MSPLKISGERITVTSDVHWGERRGRSSMYRRGLRDRHKSGWVHWGVGYVDLVDGGLLIMELHSGRRCRSLDNLHDTGRWWRWFVHVDNLRSGCLVHDPFNYSRSSILGDNSNERSTLWRSLNLDYLRWSRRCLMYTDHLIWSLVFLDTNHLTWSVCVDFMNSWRL